MEEESIQESRWKGVREAEREKRDGRKRREGKVRMIEGDKRVMKNGIEREGKTRKKGS